MSETPGWGSPDPNAEQPASPPPPSPYGAPPPTAPQYGAPQPGTPQYGAPQYGGAVPTDHPKATTVLVLGILGLVVCSVLAPVAWVMGNGVVREIDASNGAIGGRSNANIGRILGIVGTALLALAAVFILIAIIIAIAGTASGY
jgi:hypothetical protein